MISIIRLPMPFLFAFVLTAGCGRFDSFTKEEPKKDIVQNRGGTSDLTGGKNGGADAGGKNDGSEVGTKNGSSPFKEKTPDPKVAAEKQAEEKKQATLAQLCRDAFSDVKETRRKAFTQLETDYARLEPHVRTLTTKEIDPGEVEKAFVAIAALGPSFQGAWVAVEKGMGRALAEDYRLSGVMSAGIDAFVKIAPREPGVVKKLIELAHVPDVPAQGKKPANDRSGIRAAAVAALGQIAAVHAPATQRDIVRALHKAILDAGSSTALPATKALGEVARSCPQVRGDVDAFQGLQVNPKDGPFANPEVRQAAVEALFHCGARVSDKTKGILDDLKDDNQKKVRDAVGVTLKEITRQYLVVSQLDKVNIIEGKLAMPLYQAAFALVEGVKKEEAVKVLQNAAHDVDAWQTLSGLARVDKQEAVRKAALEILGDWTKPEDKLRQQLVPIFLAGLKDAGTADAAKTGLARCGAETVRQLKASKEVDLLALFRAKTNEDNPYVRTGSAEGLGQFRPTAKEDVEPLLLLLEFPGSSEKDMVTRAAAKALLHLGPEQMEFAEPINVAFVKIKDEQTRNDLQKIIENMGLKAGSGGFLSSLLLHPKMDAAKKKGIFEKLQPKNEKLLAAFGREADPKAKEMVIDRWLDVNKSKFVKDRYGESAPARVYTREILLLCKHFGPDAKKLAPILTDDLLAYSKSFKIAFAPHHAAEALGYIGPVPGVDGRKALEQASKARPLGSPQFEDIVMLAAKKALKQFPAKADDTPLPVLVLTKEEKSAGFESLFNGKDFINWARFTSNYNETKRVHFGIEDGVLHTKPQRPKTGGRIPAIGSLYSDEVYKNFILRMDVLVTEGANSAICIRCPENGYGPQVGIAINIIDNNKYRSYKRTYGSIDAIAKANIDDVPTEKWHSMEIVADGPMLQVKHNGKIMFTANLKLSKHKGAQQTEGHLILLSHGGRAEFRNIRIKKLP